MSEKEIAIMEANMAHDNNAYFAAHHEMLDTRANRTLFDAAYKRAWNAAIASMQGEAVKPEYFSVIDGDNWFEFPDDSAIIDCVTPVAVGTEYEVLAGYRAITQKYRITKVPDDMNDDLEVELISSSGEQLFTYPPSAASKIAEQDARIKELEQQLEGARKDAFMWRAVSFPIEELIRNGMCNFEIEDAYDAAISKIGGVE